MKSFVNLFRFSTKIARLKDYKYPCLDQNVKNNIIWFHGMYDSSKNFFNLAQNEQIRSISNQILLDCRNHGLSEHTETHTFKEMAYDAVEYIANRDMKDLYLIGHSMGGRTILAALQEHQAFLLDRVKGVIIVDVLPSVYAINDPAIQQMSRYLLEMKSINIIDKSFEQIEKEVKANFSDVIAANILSNIEVLQTGQLRWCVNFQAIEKSFESLMSFEVKDCLWKGPRKIMIGKKSKFTSMESVAKTYPSIFVDFDVNKDVIEFQNSGHFLYLFEQEKFINEVVSFIQKVDSDQNSPYNKKFIDQVVFDI
ncbi:alpha/beta fold hydrolase (macronuclear) [Tetrahymena thermophila SB210]|uniref:Alpha/beta fold hydrolase n=1 Tax=Tetrahymena thermophila (strain SB210) TaxID=312017 RepID=I7MFB6_TETTS|nr:alpha/beta fold hydrolase [Tetrahymena thermophila SB210]EAR83775.1 alpha/beta fold hydrolase [Tetrahymena thermophila SB210]|eukprot:XP_001031438.1 alpha/beta fold hydrolase [Tetrahymena thermophila SB210]